MLEYWLNNIKKNTETYKRLQNRINLFYLVLSLLFLYFLISFIQFIGKADFEIKNPVIIILLIISPLIPVCLIFFYEDVIQHKLNSLFDKAKLKNITDHAPEELNSILSELTVKYSISGNLLELWLNERNWSRNIFVQNYKGFYHIVFSLGYLKILQKDPVEARVIFAHELSHIRQQDPNYLIKIKIFLKGIIRFFIPYLLFIAVFLIYFSLNNIDRIKGNEAAFWVNNSNSGFSSDLGKVNAIFNINSRMGQDIQAYKMIFWMASILLIGCISLTRFCKKFAFSSETTADIGAGLIFGIDNVINCLEKDLQSGASFPFRFFDINPSIKRRIKILTGLKKEHPDFNDEKNISQTMPLEYIGSNVGKYDHFSKLQYDFRAGRNLRNNLSRKEKKIFMSVLLFVIPATVVCKFSELVYGAFDYYDTDSKIFFWGNCLFLFASIFFGIRIMKGKPDVQLGLLLLNVPFALLAIGTISQFFIVDDYLAENWYIFTFKLEGGLFFGSAILLSIHGVFLLLINLILLKRSGYTDSRDYHKYSAILLFAVFCISVYFSIVKYPERNPNLVQTIKIASFDQQVRIKSIDSHNIILNIREEEYSEDFTEQSIKNEFPLLANGYEGDYFQQSPKLKFDSLEDFEQTYFKNSNDPIHSLYPVLDNTCDFVRSKSGNYLLAIISGDKYPFEIFKTSKDISEPLHSVKKIYNLSKYRGGIMWELPYSAYFSIDEKYIIADGGDGEIKIFRVD